MNFGKISHTAKVDANAKFLLPFLSKDVIVKRVKK